MSSIDPGFNTNVLPAGDDDQTPALALGFAANFYGRTFSSLSINNNGFLTFEGVGTTGYYNTAGLGASYGGPSIISAFYGDVDTQGALSGLPSWGQGTYAGHQAFGTTWNDVGYYDRGDDRLDTFQILLVDRSDVAAGDFDIYFNYGHIQWEDGDNGSAGGVHGLGGNTASVGFNAGTTAGQASNYFELAGSRIPGSFIDGGTSELQSITNDRTPGQLRYEFRDGAAIFTSYSIVALDAAEPGSRTATTALTFTVYRDGDATAATSLSFAVAGSGAQPADPAVFMASAGTVAFAAGQSSAIVTLEVKPGVVTADLGFTVTLSGAAGTSLDVASASGTIGMTAPAPAPVPVPAPAPAPAPVPPVIVSPVLPSEDVIRISPAVIRVARFFDAASGAHFFTASAGEVSQTASGSVDLSQEQGGFTAIDPRLAASDQNAIPVYRFFDQSNGGHFLTSSATERDTVIATRPDFTPEGIGFYEHRTQQPGDLAITRFFDTASGSHFYTSSAAEAQSVLTHPGMIAEGTSFYAPAA